MHSHPVLDLGSVPVIIMDTFLQGVPLTCGLNPAWCVCVGGGVTL